MALSPFDKDQVQLNIYWQFQIHFRGSFWQAENRILKSQRILKYSTVLPSFQMLIAELCSFKLWVFESFCAKQLLSGNQYHWIVGRALPGQLGLVAERTYSPNRKGAGKTLPLLVNLITLPHSVKDCLGHWQHAIVLPSVRIWLAQREQLWTFATNK